MKPQRNRGRSTMNRLDEKSLNTNASPTVAAVAFEKAVSERAEKPSIATQYVPPAVEQKAAPRKSPFKQVKRPDGADVEAAAEEVKKEEKEKAPSIALNFIPMPAAKHEEINPFKSNEKKPIKRPASASVNRAAALKAEEEAGEEAVEVEETKEEKAKYARPSFTAALAEHERTTSFRPSNEFGMQEKIDPFKHNVAPEKESDAADEEEKVEEEKPAFKSVSESAPEPAPAQIPVEEPKHKGKGLKGLFGRH